MVSHVLHGKVDELERVQTEALGHIQPNFILTHEFCLGLKAANPGSIAWVDFGPDATSEDIAPTSASKHKRNSGFRSTMLCSDNRRRLCDAPLADSGGRRTHRGASSVVVARDDQRIVFGAGP